MKAIFLIIILICRMYLLPAQKADTVKLITAFGKPTGKESGNKIGREGGSLISDDGQVELIIPPGALTRKTSITIQPVTNTMRPDYGTAYHLLPSNIIFQQPVQIVFHFSEERIKGRESDLYGLAMQDDSGQWHDAAVVLDTVKRTLTCKTTHFSYWVDYEKVSLTPQAARVKVNKQILLQLNYYVPPPTVDEEPDLPPLSIVTVSFRPLWTVNGVVNGNQNVGTCISDQSLFWATLYKAPAAVPMQNPVAVTADLKNLNFKIGKRSFKDLKVTSNILIYDKSFEVKVEGWVENTGACNYGRASDSASFIVQLEGERTKVLDIKNYMLQIERKQPCRCSGIWVNEATTLGIIHIAGVRSLTVTPPAGPSQPYSFIRIMFTPTGAVLPRFQFTCLPGSNPLPIDFPAIPQMIEFFAKPEEQVIQVVKNPLEGFKITVKPVAD